MNTEQGAFSILVKMGLTGQIIAFLIFLLSILALYVFVERMILLSKASKESPGLLDKIKELLSSGNITGAKDLCIRTNSPLSRVLYKGIGRIGASQRDIELAMEKQIGLEIYNFEQGENTLSLVSKMAPMLGFIGTIAGVIMIFYEINTSGDYNIESISGGLYVKMITSAIGLFLGIMSYFFYYLVNNKISKAINILDKGSSDLIDILSMPAK